MARKAFTDMCRRRMGLLVWHRLVKGHWMGIGEGSTYQIKRDASNRPWRVLVDCNTLIDSNVPVLAAAQERAQQHYNNKRARAQEGR